MKSYLSLQHHKIYFYPILQVMFFLVAFVGSAYAQNDPSDVMESLMGEIRNEVNRDIKSNVRSDTREVLGEDRIIPPDSPTGFYIDPEEDDFFCNFTFTSSSMAGRCNGEGDTVTLSGTSSDGILYLFTFQLTETNPPCSGSGTGDFKVDGTGEPGTKLLGNIISDPCGPPDSFILIKQ
jgi:hypothetical protein